MGLSIIAAIAKAHHARLTISPGPHGGLDIDITFPRLRGTAKPGKIALVPT
jgi:signal transduction histidine kinase